MNSQLQTEFGHMTVQQLVNHYEKGQLNLEPGFQRKSVWRLSDRAALIDSIFMNFPVPSLFLYKRQDARGQAVYDVIDGKQRLESIFMFMGLRGFRGQRYEARIRLDPNNSDQELHDWRSIHRRGGSFRFTSYKLPTVEVSGNLGDIIELFVRINSTGKKLTSAEKRHAKYYNSPLLKKAGVLAKRYEPFYHAHRILAPGAVSRMKHVELTCELLISIVQGGLLNKKKSLDDAIGGNSIPPVRLDKAVASFVRTVNLVDRMFPGLQGTRFANAVDFYSLFMFVWDLDRRGAILTDRGRNREAEQLLVWLSLGVDQVREQQRKLSGATSDQGTFASYLMTVQGDTDSSASRERRRAILDALLAGLFEKKDSHRVFSKEQRRLIWHSDGPKRCAYPGCGTTLNWTNFTIDHVQPFALGGRTDRSNAALMCRTHNSMKGKRRVKPGGSPRRMVSAARTNGA